MLCRKLVRGFTVVELILILAVAFVGTIVLIPLVGEMTRPGCRGSRYLKDCSQIRGIVQAMAIWAGNHKGRYPLPSDVDLENTTVADAGTAKDTTSNIHSLMVFNGSVPVELLVSPAEANPNIIVYSAYQFNAPTSARVPSKALWDPALSADFTGKRAGATSYANLLPSGPRLGQWSDTFSGTEAVLGNRGPQILSLTRKAGIVMPVLANKDSNTFLIHGERSTWEGNIGFNDAHVDFLTGLRAGATAGPTYKDASGAVWPDYFHYDEPDDPTGTNIFLGIFTKAGPKPADFTAIWD